MEPQKLVVRFADGKIVKGHSINFNPVESQFTVHQIDQPGGKGTLVQFAFVKAVFFVKNFIGSRNHVEKKVFPSQAIVQGKKIKVVFKDDEVVIGCTPSYSASGVGFFMFPADPQANAHKIFVVNSQVKEARFL